MEVYHWSPKENRQSILKNGLQVFAKTQLYTYSYKGKEIKDEWSAPYICTAMNPWKALCYVSATFEYEDLMSELDLWQIELNKKDKVKFRNDESIEIIEIRVFNSILANRLNYIATRKFD